MKYLSFDIRHLKGLLCLILIDLLATMIWYSFFQIEEANPILKPSIERSLFLFLLFKFALSIPGIYILSVYIKRSLAQLGIAVLLITYGILTIIHYAIFISIVTGYHTY